jgi:hypothetical protein
VKTSSTTLDTGEPSRARTWIEWLPLLVLLLGALACRDILQPWEFMWILALAIYLGLKWVSWWRVRRRIVPGIWRSAAYLLAWPGMDAESFLDPRQRVPSPALHNWCWAFFKTALGITVFWAVARAVPSKELLLQGWVGMLGLILLLHFGSFEIVALLWQRLGVKARPIMSAPLRSRSLSEFWGRRWNLGFRQLSYDLIFRQLHRRWGAGLAGFLVFVASGLIHDLVISVPARGGYGRPTIYFVLQGLGVAIERSAFGKQLGLRQGTGGWLFMAVCTAAPVFLLFHPPFVLRVMLPFMEAVHAL